MDLACHCSIQFLRCLMASSSQTTNFYTDFYNCMVCISLNSLKYSKLYKSMPVSFIELKFNFYSKYIFLRFSKRVFLTHHIRQVHNVLHGCEIFGINMLRHIKTFVKVSHGWLMHNRSYDLSNLQYLMCVEYLFANLLTDVELQKSRSVHICIWDTGHA